MKLSFLNQRTINRKLVNPRVKVNVEGEKIVFETKMPTKRDKKMMHLKFSFLYPVIISGDFCFSPYLSLQKRYEVSKLHITYCWSVVIF